MSVADLKPGDKLSLKGKIFELQKKLNLLDVEQQNTPDYSFEPEITNYKLPHRESNFIDNMKRAEESRKERLESLKEMVMLESKADYTYKPTINKASRTIKSNQPAYIRLREKGKEYQLALEKKKVDALLYDSEGRKLFVPQRLVRTPSTVESEMIVDEYLYRDAQGRAERRQITLEEESREIQKLATEKKINKKSELLVRRKHERELRLIFETLMNQSEVKDPESHPYVTISEFHKLTEEIQFKYSQKLKEIKKSKSLGGLTPLPPRSIITTQSDPYGIVEKIWRVLDPNEVGYLHVQSFVSICLPILLSRGGNAISILASSSPTAVFSEHSEISSYSDQSLLYQYLIALNLYLSSPQLNSCGHTNPPPSTTPPPLRQYSSPPPHSSHPLPPQSLSLSLSPNTQPRQDISQRVAHYNDILANRENQTKLRMEELRYQLYEEEMRECTFRPQITQVAAKLSYYPPHLSAGATSAAAAGEDDFYSMDGETVDSNCSSVPAYERLYQQKNKIPKSIIEKRHRSLEERELEGCTFTPQIFHSSKTQVPQSQSTRKAKSVKSTTTNIPFSEGTDGSDRHSPPHAHREGEDEEEEEYGVERQSSEETYEKLNEMSTKTSIIELMRGSGRPYSEKTHHEQQEQQEQTSFPKSPPPPPPPAPEPKGYAESVHRLRNALERRKQKEKEDMKVFEFNEEKYLKKKQQLANEGCKPFRLRTEERQVEKLKVLSGVHPSTASFSSPPRSSVKSNDQTTGGASPASLQGYVRREGGELKPVRLYVEIKLGGGVKASHIAVADHDVPSELAKSFCRIYSLDSNAEGILTEVVTNQMIQGGIPIGTGASPMKPFKMKSKFTKEDLQIEENNSSSTQQQQHYPRHTSTPRNFHESEQDYLESHHEET